MDKKTIAAAWAVRQANFPPFIEFDTPTATEVLSVTGHHCALNCAHCGQHYLQKMLPMTDFNAGHGEAKSYLVSGGCDPNGKVPFQGYKDAWEQLKAQGKRLNFHVGLVDEREAAELVPWADAVSFDFVGDDATIREVFGLERTVADYVRSYRLLREHVTVYPHVCIGLRGGKLSGEYNALHLLKDIGLTGLVFIVFTPTPGTAYQDCEPPSLDEVGEVIAWARINLPTTPISLGCMRPGGRYRAALDELAVRLGVNKIVQPTRRAMELAAYLGLEGVKGEECCVL